MSFPATVVSAADLCPGMRRLVLHVPGLDADLPYADHYVKLEFPAQAEPAEDRPALRSYTVRGWDPAARELTLDFVVHGAEGLAGPWARDARPGDPICLRGPGGKWAPDTGAADVLLVGDEAAAPAIARALELAPAGARVRVFVEVADADHQIPLPATDAEVSWVHRGDAAPGVPLLRAVQAYAVPTDHEHFSAFVHGNADMIKDVRRWLFVEHGVPKDRVSISGYWRHGLTDEQWRAQKKEFNARMEAEEQGA